MCTNQLSARSTPDNQVWNLCNIATASADEVNPSIHGSKSYTAHHATHNQPPQQQRPISTQQPHSIYCAHPPVHSSPLPPPIPTKIASVCQAIGSHTKCTAAPIMCMLPPSTSQITTDSQTQTMHKILALLDELNELILCLIQLISRPDPSNEPPRHTTALLNISPQPDTTPHLNQTSCTTQATTRLMIMRPLKKVHKPSQLLLSLWPPSQLDVHSAQALPTPYLKHVRLKNPDLCSPSHMLSWHRADMRPP